MMEYFVQRMKKHNQRMINPQQYQQHLSKQISPIGMKTYLTSKITMQDIALNEHMLLNLKDSWHFLPLLMLIIGRKFRLILAVLANSKLSEKKSVFFNSIVLVCSLLYHHNDSVLFWFDPFYYNDEAILFWLDPYDQNFEPILL